MISQPAYISNEGTLFYGFGIVFRTDTVQDYHFRKEVRDIKTSKDLPDNIIGRTRQRRSLHNFFLTFDADRGKYIY